MFRGLSPYLRPQPNVLIKLPEQINRSTLRIRENRGRVCISIIRSSRGLEGVIATTKLEGLPCWEEQYRNKEYLAAKKVNQARGRIRL